MSTEAHLNKLLRRADWRFLLPNPRPARSICFADGLLAQAVAAISDDVIEPTTDPIGACDLAVAVNPPQRTLQAAWAALRPGGACYTEWYSPLAGGPSSIRRRFAAVGFTHVACYWTWPWPDRAPTLFWLPMEAPHVVQYYLANRAPSQSLGNRMLEALWRMGLKSQLVVPMCVTARKPHGETPDLKGNKYDGDVSSAIVNAEADLLEVLRARWNSWNSDPPPQHLDWFLLTRGARAINKVVGMVFAESDRSPRLIVKLARVSESESALDREAANLQAVQASYPDQARDVPQALFLQTWAGHKILGETALTGRPLFTLLRRDNYRDLALKVTDWLAALVDHAAPSQRATWWDRLIEAPIREFERNFGRVIDSQQLRETRTILATLGDLPLVCEQRDCSPWNVLIADDGELVILDWESAEPHGLPALDLIYFLTYLAFFLDGAMDSGRFTESYRAALSPTTLTGSLQAECLQHYVAHTGIDPSALTPLRLLAWLIHSRTEHMRLAAEGAGHLDPAVLERSLFVNLWKEELAHAIAGE